MTKNSTTKISTTKNSITTAETKLWSDKEIRLVVMPNEREEMTKVYPAIINNHKEKSAKMQRM